MEIVRSLAVQTMGGVFADRREKMKAHKQLTISFVSSIRPEKLQFAYYSVGLDTYTRIPFEIAVCHSLFVLPQYSSTGLYVTLDIAK